MSTANRLACDAERLGKSGAGIRSIAANPHHGIERRERVLEYGCDAVAGAVGAGRHGQCEQILAAKANRPVTSAEVGNRVMMAFARVDLPEPLSRPTPAPRFLDLSVTP